MYMYMNVLTFHEVEAMEGATQLQYLPRSEHCMGRVRIEESYTPHGLHVLELLYAHVHIYIYIHVYTHFQQESV